MNNINIENLFKCKTRNNKPGVLDVKTITHVKEQFNVNKLIETKKSKREKLLYYYRKAYENCIAKIDVANKLGKTDLLYTVKEFITNCPGYQPQYCIEYIKNKLQNDLFNTYIIDHKTIFITWLYIEMNKDSINPSNNASPNA